MTIVDRDTFLNGARQWKPRTEHVPFPQLGAGLKIIVREMSAAKKSEFEDLCVGRFDAQQALSREQARGMARAYLLICSCCSATGEPLFRVADAELLAGLPTSKMEPLVDAAMRVSGLSGSDLEEAAGNSPEDPTTT